MFCSVTVTNLYQIIKKVMKMRSCVNNSWVVDLYAAIKRNNVIQIPNAEIL